MSSDLFKTDYSTQWKTGQSGNLNGRPVGTRQAFSAGFLRDLAECVPAHHIRTGSTRKRKVSREGARGTKA
jgi:hypothetical protein